MFEPACTGGLRSRGGPFEEGVVENVDVPHNLGKVAWNLPQPDKLITD